MKTHLYKKLFLSLMTGLFIISFGAIAKAASAEYKCTSQCSFCVNYGKKQICSEKFSEDSETYHKAKKLSKMVNDGTIDPGSDLKPGFKVNQFASKYFNCDFVTKRIQVWEEARNSLCLPTISKKGSNTNSSRFPASQKMVITHKKNK